MYRKLTVPPGQSVTTLKDDIMAQVAGVLLEWHHRGRPPELDQRLLNEEQVDWFLMMVERYEALIRLQPALAGYPVRIQIDGAGIVAEASERFRDAYQDEGRVMALRLQWSAHNRTVMIHPAGINSTKSGYPRAICLLKLYRGGDPDREMIRLALKSGLLHHHSRQAIRLDLLDPAVLTTPNPVFAAPEKTPYQLDQEQVERVIHYALEVYADLLPGVEVQGLNYDLARADGEDRFDTLAKYIVIELTEGMMGEFASEGEAYVRAAHLMERTAEDFQTISDKLLERTHIGLEEEDDA